MIMRYWTVIEQSFYKTNSGAKLQVAITYIVMETSPCCQYPPTISTIEVFDEDSVMSVLFVTTNYR